MKTIEMIYLWAQVIFSVCVILFGVSYAIRCAVERCDVIFVIFFGGIAYVGYRLLFRASIDELHEARARRKGGDK